MSVASSPPTRTRSVPSGSAPRQTRTNGFCSHSRPMVVSSVWPGRTRISAGSFISTSTTERRICARSPPPTASRNSTSPEKHASPFTTNARWSSLWPGVGSASTRRPPVSSGPFATGTGKRDRISPSPAMWSGSACVVSRYVTVTPSRATAAKSGSSGAPLSTKTAVPPGSSATRYAFASQPGCMLSSIRTGARLPRSPRPGGSMPGLMSRASTIVKAKFSKLLDRAEDPSETLDYSYERQLQLLQNVKRGVADVVTAKKRLQMQTQQLEQSVVKLETQARQALGAGREDLARQALERKSAVQQQLQGLDQQVKQLEAQQQKLVSSEKQLQAKIEAFRSQKEVIKAQYSAAEAQVRIGEAATGIGEQMADTGLAIQRAKDKTEQMQARASAIDELTTSGALEDFTSDQTELDRELGQLASKSQVDQELAALKSELGPGEKQKELQQ